MDDFLEKCTKISLKLGISGFKEGGQSRLLEQKQLNIDTNILHRVGLEFDVDSKNRIKNYKFGFLLKFGTSCILIDYFDNYRVVLEILF